MGSQQRDPSSISRPSGFPAHNTPKHPMEASAWKSPADSHWSKFLICSKAPHSPQNDECYSCWTLTGNALKLPKERFTWRKEGLYCVYIGKQNCESVGRCGRWGTCPVSSVLNQLRDIQETLDLGRSPPHIRARGCPNWAWTQFKGREGNEPGDPWRHLLAPGAPLLFRRLPSCRWGCPTVQMSLLRRPSLSCHVTDNSTNKISNQRSSVNISVFVNTWAPRNRHRNRTSTCLPHFPGITFLKTLASCHRDKLPSAYLLLKHHAKPILSF